jgi:hypothetical protein
MVDPGGIRPGKSFGCFPGYFAKLISFISHVRAFSRYISVDFPPRNLVHSVPRLGIPTLRMRCADHADGE